MASQKKHKTTIVFDPVLVAKGKKIAEKERRTFTSWLETLMEKAITEGAK